MMALMHLRAQNHRRVIICFFRETEDLLLLCTRCIAHAYSLNAQKNDTLLFSVFTARLVNPVIFQIDRNLEA